MNIFKILASGDGTLKEPNVSAFLAYLLNPNEDHGIGDELLKRVLEPFYGEGEPHENLKFLFDDEGKIRNLTLKSNIEIEVLPEQAFYSENSERKSKQVVDIVILCREKIQTGKESFAIAKLKGERGELKQIFLIENKISDWAVRENQLLEQYTATLATLKEADKNKISVIFISPYENKSIEEFNSFFNQDKNISKVHIFWRNEEDDKVKKSLNDYLIDILQKEANGQIESINDYTKQTLKSFINFIQNGFSSKLEEERREAAFKKDIYYNFNDFKESVKVKDTFLNPEMWNVIEKTVGLLNEQYGKEILIRHSPGHPISVFINDRNGKKNGTKVFSVEKDNYTKLGITYILRNYKHLRGKVDELQQFLQNDANFNKFRQWKNSKGVTEPAGFTALYLHPINETFIIKTFKKIYDTWKESQGIKEILTMEPESIPLN